jgi:O-antigen/teichoic acid export membrane protein
LLGAAAVNLGGFVVGRMLGNAALGLYDMAMTLPMLLIIYAAGAISQVAFPALSRLQDDRERLMQGYLVIQRYGALILLPVGLGLSVVTPAFVRSFYPPVWWPMIPVMQAAAVFATVSVQSWTVGDVFKATARLDIQWRLDLMYVLALAPALVIGGMLGGIVGIAVAHILVVAPFRIYSLHLVHRFVGAEYSAIRNAFQPALLASAAMVGVCVLLAQLSSGLLAPSTLLFAEVVLGVCVYAGVACRIDPKLREQVVRAAPVWRRAG